MQKDDRLHEWLVEMITTLLRSGRTLDEVCNQLAITLDPKAIRLARQDVEAELGRIRIVRDPPSIVDDVFVTMENRRAKALLTARNFAEIKAAWHSEELPGRK